MRRLSRGEMIRIELCWDRKNKARVLLVAGFLLVLIAIFDWRTGNLEFFLGFLYLFPIILATGFLPRWAIVLLALLCAYLTEIFSQLNPADSRLRLAVLALALCGCGLFLSEVLKNRQLGLAAPEQGAVLVGARAA